jgi:hypothetical protein
VRAFQRLLARRERRIADDDFDAAILLSPGGVRLLERRRRAAPEVRVGLQLRQPVGSAELRCISSIEVPVLRFISSLTMRAFTEVVFAVASYASTRDSSASRAAASISLACTAVLAEASFACAVPSSAAACRLASVRSAAAMACCPPEGRARTITHRPRHES